MAETVLWSQLRAERSYWVRPPYADHTFPAVFLGWNLDHTEASFAVHYGQGRDRPVPVSPQGGWEIYDDLPEDVDG